MNGGSCLVAFFDVLFHCEKAGKSHVVEMSVPVAVDLEKCTITSATAFPSVVLTDQGSCVQIVASLVTCRGDWVQSIYSGCFPSLSVCQKKFRLRCITDGNSAARSDMIVDCSKNWALHCWVLEHFCIHFGSGE